MGVPVAKGLLGDQGCHGSASGFRVDRGCGVCGTFSWCCQWFRGGTAWEPGASVVTGCLSLGSILRDERSLKDGRSSCGVPSAPQGLLMVSLAVGVEVELCYGGVGGVARNPRSLG